MTTGRHEPVTKSLSARSTDVTEQPDATVADDAPPALQRLERSAHADAVRASSSVRARRCRSFVCLAMSVLVMGCSADPLPPSSAAESPSPSDVASGSTADATSPPLQSPTSAPVVSPTLNALPSLPGSIAPIGRAVTLADGDGPYATVAVTEVRKLPAEMMDNASQEVPFRERFYRGHVAVYAVRVRIEPTRDLPRFGGTGGWFQLCPGSGRAIGASMMVAAPPDGSYLPTTLEGYKAGETYEGWVMTVARADIPVVLGFTPDDFNDPPREHPDGSLAWPPPASWIINQPDGQPVPAWASSLGLCLME